MCNGCHARLNLQHKERLKHQHHAQYEAKAKASTAGAGAAAASAAAASSAAAPAAASSSSSSSTAVQSRSAAQLAREAIERVIYNTASLCPKCSLLEKRGFDQYKPAQLLEQYRGIWLRMTCERHGPHTTLVCKERNFWWRCYGFQEVWNANLKTSGLANNGAGGVPRSISQGISSDMEDLGKMLTQSLKSSAPPVDNLPMSFEMALYVDGRFVPDAELEATLLAFLAKWPNRAKVRGACTRDASLCKD